MEAAAMDPGVRFFPDVDDFLNFNFPDVDDRADGDGKPLKALSDPNSFDPALNGLLTGADGPEEEELEWLTEGTFPPVEFGILSENPGMVLNHQSPVSVLENSSNTSNNSNGGSTITSCCAGGGGSVAVPTRHPVKARSKRRRRRRRDLPTQQCWWSQEYLKNAKPEVAVAAAAAAVVGGSKIGRRCLHCQTDKTPQWRAGPMGPKTLCNACGVRYKSGRLVPEYRPASSPTFSSVLHSNSHRKIVEMRKKKLGGIGGGMMVLNKDCEYRVG